MSLAHLKGKTALITGSTGGIGLAIATGLAQAGCNIVLHGIETPEQVQPAIRQIQETGVDMLYLQSDLQHLSEIEHMFDALTNRFGGVDILVNNAVTRHFSPVEDFPTEKWDQAMAVNVTAPFHTIRKALPMMRQHGWGRIINMASVYGQRGTSNRIDYVTSKSAIIGMTKAIAAEIINDNITCNAICPGTVLTPNIDSRINQLMQQQHLTRQEAEKEFLKGKQPGGKLIPAEHVARQALYLCELGSEFINGAVLPIENGWLAF